MKGRKRKSYLPMAWASRTISLLWYGAVWNDSSGRSAACTNKFREYDESYVKEGKIRSRSWSQRSSRRSRCGAGRISQFRLSKARGWRIERLPFLKVKGKNKIRSPGSTYEQCTEREGTTSKSTRIDRLRLWIGISHQHPLIRKSLIDFSQIPTELRDLGLLRLLMSLRATF